MAGGLAIILSGGGAKGAFQVGVVHKLVVNRGVRVDIVRGVSISATSRPGAHLRRPLDVQISHYRFAPIRIIESEAEVAATLDFNPAKIRSAIDARRRVAVREWDALEPLLS